MKDNDKAPNFTRIICNAEYGAMGYLGGTGPAC